MKKNINDNGKSNKKRLLTAAVLLTQMLVVSMPVYAWFSNKREIVTMTKIQSPVAINIGAGNQENCAYIDMSGIDVSNPEVTSKNFVFCVYSTITSGDYKIQLAHTTNIPFTYRIYKASVYDENGTAVRDTVVYHSKLQNADYYYTKGEEIEGAYKNKDTSSIIANDSQHEVSYSNYSKDNVQINAEPLYWQNNTNIKPTANSGNNNVKFVDYYILNVSWNKDEVENNKETDMVYITAGMVN